MDETAQDDIQASLASLYECKTEADARKLTESLPPDKRRKVLMLADSSKLPFIKKGAIQKALRFSLSDSQGDDTTQSQVNALYDSLFALINAAKMRAEAEKKSLHVVIGESHPDRTGLLVSSLILHIARRLGIDDLGVELFPEESHTKPDGIEVLGFPAVWRLVDSISSIPSETDEGHSTTLGAIRKNVQFQMLLAKRLGMSSFSNDPKGIIDYNPEKTLDDTFKKRDAPTAETLNNLSGKNLVSIHGYSHFNGLVPLLKSNDALALFIDDVHLVTHYKTINSHVPSHETLANATPLPATAKDAGELGKRYNPSEVIHAQVPGKGVTTAKEALEMAQEADRAKGKICMKRAESWVGRTQGSPSAQHGQTSAI